MFFDFRSRQVVLLAGVALDVEKERVFDGAPPFHVPPGTEHRLVGVGQELPHFRFLKKDITRYIVVAVSCWDLIMRKQGAVVLSGCCSQICVPAVRDVDRHAEPAVKRTLALNGCILFQDILE